MWKKHAKRLHRVLHGQNQRLLVSAAQRDLYAWRLRQLGELAGTDNESYEATLAWMLKQSLSRPTVPASER